MTATQRTGISRATGIVLALVIVVALTAVGFVFDKAVSYPGCNADTGGCPNSIKDRVATKRQGKTKFLNAKLGHNPGIRYGKAAKRAISIKIMRVHNRQVRSARGFYRGDNIWDRQDAWQAYGRVDTCVSAADMQSGAGAPRGLQWTCEGMAAWNEYRADHPPADWTPGGVKVIMCGAVAGITWKGALAAGGLSGPGGPWTMGGIIAGGALCAWGDDLANLAD